MLPITLPPVGVMGVRRPTTCMEWLTTWGGCWAAITRPMLAPLAQIALSLLKSVSFALQVIKHF